jgi:glutaredoxin
MNKKKNIFAIIGFTLSIISGPIIALILSIVGYNKSKKYKSGKELSIAGIIISVIKLIICIICILIFVLSLGKSLNDSNIEYKCSHSYGCEKTIFGNFICAYKDIDGISEDIICRNNMLTNSVVNIYVFHTNTCPHCRDLLDFFEDLKMDNDYNYKFELKLYEVSEDVNNKRKMMKASEYFDINYDELGVPFYVIGNKYRTGFKNPSLSTEEEKKHQEDAIKELIDDAYYYGYNDINDYFNK